MKESQPSKHQQKHERNTFLFLAVFVAPVLSIIIVAGFGFSVWISQIIFGPPSI